MPQIGIHILISRVGKDLGKTVENTISPLFSQQLVPWGPSNTSSEAKLSLKPFVMLRRIAPTRRGTKSAVDEILADVEKDGEAEEGEELDEAA